MSKLVSAYMTVEAALLLPMVLCVIVIGYYVSFFLYDRCVLNQDSYLLCLRESYRKDEEEPSVSTEDMEEAVGQLIGLRCFGLDTLEGQAQADGKWAVYEGSADVLPAVFGSYFLMPEDIWQISYTAKSRKNDPSWEIRSWRRKTAVLKEGTKLLEQLGGLTE